MKVLRRIILSAGVLFALTAAGCGAFCRYPASMQRAQDAFSAGEYDEALDALDKVKVPSATRILYLLEKGTLLQAAGKLEKSNQAFLKASALIREQHERAIISMRDTAAFTQSLLVNDLVRPYRPAPFERVMMHTQLCLNFLMLGQLDDARVEVRQAYEVQRQELAEHEERIERTRREAEKMRIPASELEERLDARLAGQRKTLESAGNLYQNAFNTYLSSVVYEINGELSDAYLDAKTVHEMHPNFLPARRDLLRLSRRLGLREDYEKWRRDFGEELEDSVPPGRGEIVLLYECGIAPAKEEARFDVPIPIEDHWNIATIAIPLTRKRRNPVTSARLVIGEMRTLSTQPIMSMDAAATRNLLDQAPGIAIRQLIRVSLRMALTEKVRKEWGDLAFIVTLFAGSILEQADLRCWMSLPSELQVLRVTVPTGRHVVNIELLDQNYVHGFVSAGEIIVNDGRITLIHLRSTGIRGYANAHSF